MLLSRVTSLHHVGDPGEVIGRIASMLREGGTVVVVEWDCAERLHTSPLLLRVLDRSFAREHLTRGPYVFPDLAETSMDDEQAAIDAGDIKATRIDYVGRLHTRV